MMESTINVKNVLINAETVWDRPIIVSHVLIPLEILTVNALEISGRWAFLNAKRVALKENII